MTSQLILDGDFGVVEIVGLERGWNVTLASLGPLPTKILPARYDKPPRTPTTVATYQFFIKASNTSTLKTQDGRVQGTGSEKSQNAGLVRD